MLVESKLYCAIYNYDILLNKYVRLCPLFSLCLIFIHINLPWFVLRGFPVLYNFNQFVGKEVLKGKTLCSTSDGITAVEFRKLRNNSFVIIWFHMEISFAFGFLFVDVTGTKWTAECEGMKPVLIEQSRKTVPTSPNFILIDVIN